jgi:DNA polymerase
MFVGEAPGVQEEQMRKCWVGKAGKELTRYARQAGIELRDCWLTNLVKHRPTTRAKSGNVKPTAAGIKRDEGELIGEIERVRPTFIVGVGAVASRWLLGRSIFTDMESCHGFPYATANWRALDRGRGEGPSRLLADVRTESLVRIAHFTCVPCYHPAAGLHSPEQQPVIYSDFMTLGKYVRGTLPCVTPRDIYPDPDYYEPRSSIKLVKSLPVAVDTEGLAGRVWGLSFSQFAGSAGVVRKTNKRTIQSMKEQLLNG